MKYSHRGINEPSDWKVELGGASSWLTWNRETLELSGIPNNTKVGSYKISINLSDDQGHFDKHEFYLNVLNKPPSIITEDIEVGYTDNYYYSDYDCDQDGQGEITWAYEPILPFLEMNPETGTLTGTPGDGDVGLAQINVSVNDGNGGWDYSRFILEIIQSNRNPIISAIPETIISEDDYYLESFSAYDPDGDRISWSMDTNAQWLTFDDKTKRLSGIPRNDDVGSSFVNITVFDDRGGIDFQNFTITVLNTNDDPFWVQVFNGATLNEGDDFIFNFIASDPDLGDVIEYSLSSFPFCSISIDQSTGSIFWKVDSSGLTLLENGTTTTTVTVEACDGNIKIYHSFDLFIMPNKSPSSRLISPQNEGSYKLSEIVLRWNGIDPERDELVYDIFLGTNRIEVEEMDKDSLIMESTKFTEFKPEYLIIGEQYFWTIIPKDHRSNGYCLDSVYNFHVNTPPTIEIPNSISIKAGDPLDLVYDIADSDIRDKSSLRVHIANQPEGMTLNADSKLITWIPSFEEVGTYNITIGVSDGKETTEVIIDISVIQPDELIQEEKKDDDETTYPLFIWIIAIIISIALILMLIFIFKKWDHTMDKSELSDNEEEKGG
jgi:hypothetical protein